MEYGHMGTGCGVGMLSAALWILVILGIIALVRHFFGRGPMCVSGHSAETPLDILKKRYARGELGQEEYERIKKELS